MVAIVSGNSLGLGLTSLGTLGQQGASGVAAQGRNGQSVYVNVANGNLVVQDQDEYLASTGPDAAVLRTYNSQGLLSDDNGDNWIGGVLAQPLQLTGALNAAGSSIRRADRDGSVATYTYDVSRGLYVSTDGGGAYDTISYAASGLTWRDGSSGNTELYQASGSYQLLSSSDADGNTLVYGYNAAGNLSSVTTASGETSYYDYSGNELTGIRTVTADGVTSTRVHYGYDASNRLATVTVDLSPGDNSIADGNVYRTTYTYDGTSKRVASITQSDGTSLHFTYVRAANGSYLVASVTDGLNQTTRFTYNLNAGKSGYATVTDPQGLVTRYDMDAAGRLTKITAPAVAGGTTPSTQFAYDANGNVSSVTDGGGRTITYGYDANGNRVLQRDQAGNTVTRSYDANNQLVTETLYLQPDPDAAGSGQPSGAQTTRYVYDSARPDLLRFTLSADGRVTEYRYDSYGEQTSTIAYRGAAYPVAGLSATATPSEADLEAWVGAQDLTATERVDIRYDARGQVQSTTSYDSVDASGAGIVDGTQSVVRYVHDRSGQLLQTVSAKEGTTTYTYDGLGRVLSSTNALGQVTLTQYDDARGRTVVTQADGLATTSIYDADGRLVSVLQSNAGASLGQTSFYYDAGGNLRMTQDATGVRHWMFYDAAGRKTADVDGNGTMTEYSYDGSGLLTYTVTYATAVNTATLVDANGLPIAAQTAASIRPIASIGDGREWRAYDAAQRLVKVARGMGTSDAVAVVENRYDGESHLVEVVQYAGQLTATAGSVAPGAIATPASSSQDRVTRNFYDADGHLTGTLDAEGYLTVYSYNAAGEQADSIRYATATDSSLRAGGTLAQLRPASSASDIREVTLYNAKGQVVGQVDGEGYLTESVYDAGGNLAQSVRYANRVLAPVTTASTLAQIRPASSSADQATSRRYDALDRLTQETSPQGVVTQYGYDSVGNLVSTSAAVGTSEVRTVLARYDLQGRLTGELSANGAALLTGDQTQAEVDAIWAQYGTRYAYDAAGRRISMTAPSGATTCYYYDADGHLTHTIDALGEVVESRYDAQGRLVTQESYTGRIGTQGLTGGLVTAALTDAVAAIRSASDLVVTYTYTSDSRVATSADGLGNVTRHVYNAFGDEIETDQSLATGQLVRTYTVDRRGLRTGTDEDPSGINAITTTTYDAFGRAIQTIDANGNPSEQSFDRLGRIVTLQDPLNAQRRITYDAFGRVLTQTDALGKTSTYAYDAVARTMTVTTPEGVATTTTSNPFGQVQSITDGNGQVTRYTYDRDGNLLQTTTPLTTDSSSYDASDRLIQTTDADGTQVVYSYDAANRVLTRRVDPHGLNLTTTYAYDGAGQQVSLTDANGIVTTTAYDANGNVLRRTVDPAGLNLQTVYAYDAQGNVLSVVSPGGSTTLYTYDALGRRVGQVVDPAGLDLRQGWTYDKKGNVVSSTDALGNTTRYVYDADDRQVYAIDPLGNVRQTVDDAAGRTVEVVAYVTPIPLAGLPPAPTVAQVQSLIVSQPTQDAVQQRVYDDDGRMTATVDGTGAVTTYTYDGNGNVISRVSYATRIDLASWQPGMALPVVADSAHDERQTTVYDALDRAVYTVDATGAVVAQVYDGNGNVVQRIAYATAIAAGTPMTQAGISAAVAAVANPARDASVRNTYDAAGRLTWSVDGTGAVTQRAYDNDGNLVQQVAYATAIAAGATPSSVAASANDRVTSMAYDSAGRLVLQIDPLHAVTEQVYDADGNVVRRTAYANPIASIPPLGTTATAAAVRAAISADASADRSSVYGYDAAGRQVLVIDANGSATARRYDADGHVTTVTAHANLAGTAGLANAPTLASLQALLAADVEADRVSSSIYDAAGRVVYAVDAAGSVKGFQYDGVGRLTATTAFGVTIAPNIGATAATVADAIAAAKASSRTPPAADQTSRISYNAAGQVIADTDAMGKVETYTYDALGNKLSFKNRNGFVWTYTYDAAGRMLTEATPPVSLTSTALSASGSITATADPDEVVVTTLAYDALGNLTRRTEATGRPEQRVTQYRYDAVGRQIQVIYPAVGVYNASADPVTVNGATGAASRVETIRTLETDTYYDALGNALANRDVGGALSQKVYDRMGRVIYEVDALGYVTGYTRNAFGDVTTLTRYATATTLAETNLTQAAQSATKEQVQAALNASGVNHSADRTLWSTYDKAGRLLQTTQPSVYVYDSSGAAGKQTDTEAATTRNTYDAFGQLVQVSSLRNALTDSWVTTTHYFDAAGRETATVDAMGYLTVLTYDAFGNTVGTTQYATALGANGWSTSGHGMPGANANDRETQYTYDALNRKTSTIQVNVPYSVAAAGAGGGAPAVTTNNGSLVTRYTYDAVGNQTSVQDAQGNTTYTYFDALGRVEAVAAPARTVTDAGTGATSNIVPLTAYQRDAYGNVVVQVEYANGAKTAGLSAPALPSGADRRTASAYDSLGHAVATTDSSGATRYTSFDAYGHAVKKWQGVTGNDGVTRTDFEVDVYDKLGQLVETRTPASTSVLQGGLVATYTPAGASSPNQMALGWSNLTDPGGGTVRVEVDYMASATVMTDEAGHPLTDESGKPRPGQPSHLATATKDLSAASSASGATLTWSTATDSAVYIRVMQLTGGQWVTKWEGSPAQGSGSGIATLTQQQAGLVYTSMTYNAFGEMTTRGTQGGKQEYFDYDNAGRLWRTNTGDGVDQIRLYDALGNKTAEIRSSGSGGSNADIKGFANARAADANPSTRRIDMQYDALGRITSRTDAARQDVQGGVTVQRQFTTATIVQSEQSDESGVVGGESGYRATSNEITLGWNSLSGLGSGDIQVTVQYNTSLVPTSVDENGRPLTYSGGTARSYTSGVLDADAAANGATLTWVDRGTTDVGVSQVTRITVQKRDVDGIWQTVIDQAPGYGTIEVEVAAPPNGANVVDGASTPGVMTGFTLQMRVAGSSGNTGWWTAKTVNFGAAYRFDAGGLAAGAYEYRVTITPPGQAAQVVDTGTVAITQPALSTITTPISYGIAPPGILSWAPPPSGTAQTLHYRVSGSSDAWSTLNVIVTARPGLGQVTPLSGVDTSGLAPGSYQFELLWSDPQGVPISHATGTFTVVGAQPSYWVAPVNLPNITGLAIGTDVVGASVVGQDESGQPIYAGGTTVPALTWRAAGATVVQYRVSGGAWTSLAIDNAAQRTGESGLTGVQKSPLNGLPPGTYEVRILAGSPATAQATATLTIYAQPAGYYQTVYVQVPTYTPRIAYYQPIYTTQYGTRQVPYSVWVKDSPVITGYDERGQPIYARDESGNIVYTGHYVTQYRTETYSYQVQTGQRPVYATDENGRILYDVSYTSQPQQQWVQPPTPGPTVVATTPPYTAGYWVAAVPQQYGVSITTPSGTPAISTTAGAAIGQSATINGGTVTQRPTVHQTFDRWGNVTSISDPRAAGWITTYQYNANNQLIQQVQPDATGVAGAGAVTSLYYDQLGRQVAVKDGNGHVNGEIYDAAGNVVKELHADGGVVTYGYDAFGDKVKSTDAIGKVVTYTYDKMGRMLTTGEGTAEVYTTNSGNGVVDLGWRAITESWTYDQLGRKLTQTNGNGETVRYTYDLRGNVVATTQPMGQVERAAFDAQGHKIAEVDADAYASTWSYDYFGLLTASTDLGGARYTYTYDNARQLISQTSTRGQSITYSYDAAGQQTTIHDWADGKVTSYAYDLGGRHVREKTVQGGVTYQDNHLAYDAVGNLRDVADASVHVSMAYDNAGNRTRIVTHVGYQGTGGDTSQNTDKYFLYDAMNRQIVVDGANAAGAINAQQGHQVQYDKDGNRISDTYYGNAIFTTGGQSVVVGYNEDGSARYGTQPLAYQKTTGLVTETYGYDALNRLQSVVRNGVQIDLRFYDGADRVIESGPRADLPAQYATLMNDGVAPGDMNGSETHVNRYDADGRLLHESVRNSDGTAKVDISYDPNESYRHGLNAFWNADGYDAVGNLQGYIVENHVAGSITEYTTSLARYAGYEQAGTSGASTTQMPGSTTERYDANGYLVGHVDNTQGKDSKTFVNDANGVALYVNQAGNVARQLVVNGQVLGIYGVGVDPDEPASGSDNNPNFADLVDFNFGYSRISASYPNPAPGAYQVRSGDTLQSIALGAYGDSALWYRIAESNGLQSSSDLKVGQTLNIPNRVSTIDNNNWTFKPYDPSRIQGDLSPSLATPQNDDGCGALGEIITIIVTVVVTAYAGPVIGDLAFQIAAGATGVRDDFSWKELALAYVNQEVSQFIPSGLDGVENGPLTEVGTETGKTIASVVHAVEVNATSQTIGVVTGLQHTFDWRSAAATGLGAAAGQTSAEAVGLTGPNQLSMAGAERLIRSAVSGLVAGTVTSVAKGGRISAVQIAVDAFGNALGQSLAGANSSTGYSDAAFSAQEDARDAAMSQLIGVGAPPAPGYAPGQLGSGSFGVGGVDSTLFQKFGPSASSTPDQTDSPQEAFRRQELSGQTSVAGTAYRAMPGDDISKVVGTSNPQVIGNFMRSNGLASSTIIAGRNYFVPEDVNAYGQSGALGQAVLNADNARLAQIAFERANEASVAGLGDPTNRATFRTAGAGYQAQQPSRLGYGGLSGVSMIPTDGYSVAPPAQTTETSGFFGKLAGLVDDFNNSEVGHMAQGLPAEGAVVGDLKSGLLLAGTIGSRILGEAGAADRILASTARDTTALAQLQGTTDAISIGRSSYGSIGEFSDAVAAKYQALYDQGYAIASQNAAEGLIPNTARAIGSSTDEFARVGLRDWLVNAEGIEEGPRQIIQVNRRLYDPSGSGAYRIPDVYIPGSQTILDGSISFKTATSRQVVDFGAFSGGAKTTIIAPRGLQWGSYGIIP